MLASLIRNPVAARLITGAVAVQVGLTALGLGGWECPARATVGLPCPGCGLTRATEALLSGRWIDMLQLHAFAPVLLACLSLIALAAVVPSAARSRLAEGVETVERRTGLTIILSVLLIAYWLARLICGGDTLALLVA